MKRALKWLLPALILAEIILVWSGLLDLADAALVIAGIEVLLVLTAAGEVVVVVRRYRRGRAAGLDLWAALEAGLAVLLPRKAARFVLHEPRLFVALFRWTFRRAKLADSEFGYHRRSVVAAILPLVAVTSPIELFVVHLLASVLSPWGWVKWALLLLGIYAILWLLGLYASLVTLPHRLEGDGLRLHYGALAEGFVPFGDSGRRTQRASGPRTGRGPTDGSGKR